MRFIDIDTILFGKYKVTEELGGGGQSFVYRAEDISVRYIKSWKRTVFIKQYSGLTDVLFHYPKVEKHYTEISNRLKDIKNFICLPNEIKVSEFHDSVIAVFPFVQGVKLSEKINEMHYDERVRIAFAIVNTFRKIHEAGIAHLDLKPDNIVVYNEPKTGVVYIKLIDLDGSKIDETNFLEASIKTPGYASPEHYSNFGLETGVYSDIFSLGITLIELLTSRYPFQSTKSYLQEALKEEYDIISTPIHRDIISTLLSCLEMNLKNRPSAGKILSVFNKHFDNRFLASDPSENWDPEKKKVFVEIKVGNPENFVRAYFENKIITSTDLRGSGITNLSGDIFAIIFEKRDCYFHLLNKAYSAFIDDYKISTNTFYKLLGSQKIKIMNTDFNIKVISY